MLERVLDQILLDVGAAYQHEQARFRSLELPLLRPFEEYNPDLYLARLQNLKQGVAHFRQVYGCEPPAQEQYQRALGLVPVLEGAYMAAYRRVATHVAFPRFLNDLEWSRAFAMTLADIYRIDKQSTPATCQGLLNSPMFRHEKPHLQPAAVDTVMNRVYGEYTKRHLKDLQGFFSSTLGYPTAAGFLQAIVKLEQQLQGSATSLVTQHSVRLGTFNRRTHYLATVRELLQWFEGNLCLSAAELHDRKADRRFTVVDVQAHATYQHAEYALLQGLFNALQKEFEDGHEDFNTFVSDVQLGLREIVEYRAKLRRTAEYLNQNLEHYIPEKYLQYLVEAEDQYRESVFFHFHKPVSARSRYPKSVYGQVRADQLIAMIPEFAAMFHREREYGAQEHKQKLYDYMQADLDDDD